MVGSVRVMRVVLFTYFAALTLFAALMLPSAFVAWWRFAARIRAEDVFQVREDEPEPRVGAGLH
jgi:hypothetical protein